MNFEKYTERARGFIQSAQTVALAQGHQQFTPEHLLKVLLDDQEGLAAGLIERAGGRATRRACRDRAGARRRCPRSSGGVGPALSRAADWPRSSTPPRRSPRRPATASSPSSGCCWRWPWRRTPGTAKILADAGVTPQTLNAAIKEIRKGRTADSASAESQYDALKKYARDLTAGGARGQARPGHRPRRGNPPHHPGAVAPHQEQSGADRRARRRQDGDRRGPGAAHRQRRRAGEPEGQAADGARHGRADRRREISRRVRGAAEGRAQRDHRRPRARSSCSSTRCTRWSAPARRTARWTPRTC